MKTLAIRLDDDVHAQLVIVAHLYEQTLTDTIRMAIESYLERQRADGDLTARAQALVEEIDREASARRQAIEDLLGRATGAETAGADSADSEAPVAEGSSQDKPRRRRGSGVSQPTGSDQTATAEPDQPES